MAEVSVEGTFYAPVAVGTAGQVIVRTNLEAGTVSVAAVGFGEELVVTGWSKIVVRGPEA